ncbi:MAG: ABC transporter ATP-binding protein [Synergistaceae bacterium]|jgi:oligopeptide/dipeptide ABC transporter ATP-binding protein|nr:ABC transporter ATP-binding protein [Synergistaceae bacterium]
MNDRTETSEQGTASLPLIEVRELTRYFPLKQSLLDFAARRPVKYLRAVDNVSFGIDQGETMGLVGESGCGKSTLARTIIRLYDPQKGKILFRGRDITGLQGAELRAMRREFQIVFQDPYSSLNPRMSVYDMLSEILRVHKICSPKEIPARVLELLERVGLNAQCMNRFASEFSGGQRQRIGIARALALSPEFIIADEPVSALDVSIQAQIINLLNDLQKQLGLTMLFISHDLRVVRCITHRVAVMYLGKIVETGDTDQVFTHPRHPYSRVLTRSAPMLDPRKKTRGCAIGGELPNPINVPPGCRFHPRCEFAREKCRTEEPPFLEISTGRRVSCHYPLN